MPDEPTIAATVLGLLKDAGEEHVFNGGSVRSGRFEAIREVEEGENVEWCIVNLQVGFATAADSATRREATPGGAEGVARNPKPSSGGPA